MDRNYLIFLIGPRGSGKSTVARLLAERLGWTWCDADAVLEEKHGRSIRQIFADEGEEGFRSKEAELLRLLSADPNVVVATGGGVVLRPENRECLRRGLVIWLTATPETLISRIQQDAGSGERRPALAQGGLAEVIDIVAHRAPLYAQCADISVETTDITPEEIVHVICRHLEALDNGRSAIDN